MKLLAGGFESGGAGDPTKEDIENLLSGDVVSRLVAELGEAFPMLKEVAIDERDIWIGEAVKAAPGGRLVVVVGAGHLDGVERNLLAPESADTAPLARIPPRGNLGRTLGFAIPAGDPGSARLDLGHPGGRRRFRRRALLGRGEFPSPPPSAPSPRSPTPLTVLAAFVSAPFTSLTPVMGAGYVTAFVQAWVRPPRVFELRTLKADALAPRRWFRNRALRIILALLLPTIGSAIGTFVGGSRLISGAFG